MQAQTPRLGFLTGVVDSPRGLVEGHLWALPLDDRTGFFPLRAGTSEPDLSRTSWDAAISIALASSYPRLAPQAALRTVTEDEPGRTIRRVRYWPGRRLLTSRAGESGIGLIEEEPNGGPSADPLAGLSGEPLGAGAVRVAFGPPLVIAWPNNLAYHARNVHRYADFARAHRARRPVLFTGTSDGAVHAFDVATGAEIFAFRPSAAQAVGPGGPPVSLSFDDVYLDAPWAGGGERCPPQIASGGRNCQWRTVLIGGTPRSRGVFALDVTRPDGEETGTTVPDCLFPATKAGVRPRGCVADYPTLLWEFADAEDRDRNGRPDLGVGVPAPVLGRLRLAGTEKRELGVVMFGGGLGDPGAEGASRASLGNFLYVLDAAKGRLLFKTGQGLSRRSGATAARPFGRLASEVSAVDLDQDGFLDAAYFGDALGQLWKLDASALTDAEPKPTLLFDGAGGGARAAPELPSSSVAVLRVGRDAGTGSPRTAVVLGYGSSEPDPQRGSRNLRPEAPVAHLAVLVEEPGEPKTLLLGDLERLGPASPWLGDCSRAGPWRPRGWVLDLPGEMLQGPLVALAFDVYATTLRTLPGELPGARFYRLFTPNGDPCRGPDCCAGWPGAWIEGRDRDRGRGPAGLGLGPGVRLSAPFVYVDAFDAARVGVFGEREARRDSKGSSFTTFFWTAPNAGYAELLGVRER